MSPSGSWLGVLKTRNHVLLVLGFSLLFAVMYVTLSDKSSSPGGKFGVLSTTTNLGDRGSTHGVQLQGSDISQDDSLASYDGVDSQISLDRLTYTEESGTNRTWDKIQKTRTSHIQRTCELLYPGAANDSSLLWDSVQNNEDILLDPGHRVLFCSIPKAACSSWRVALALLTHRLPDTSPSVLQNVHYAPFMNDIGLGTPPFVGRKRLQQAVDTFTSFLMVRHPLERLVSAYRDKFQTYNKWTRHFQIKYGRKIVDLYRGDNATAKSRENGHDVTFAEFVRFITDESVPWSRRMNRHWAPYQQLCHPCLIRYRHVLKFETFSVDTDAVLGRYFAVGNSAEFFPRRNMKKVPSRDLATKFYASLPPDLVSRLVALYRVDIAMFGYDVTPSWLTS